jgi:hypothetical protein
MATVTIQLEAKLVDQARSRAESEGKSLEQLIEEAITERVLRRADTQGDSQAPEADDELEDLDAFFKWIDSKNIRFDGPPLTDDEMYTR